MLLESECHWKGLFTRMTNRKWKLSSKLLQEKPAETLEKPKSKKQVEREPRLANEASRIAREQALLFRHNPTKPLSLLPKTHHFLLKELYHLRSSSYSID